MSSSRRSRRSDAAYRLAILAAAGVAAAFYAALLADPMALSPNPDWAKVALLVMIGRRGLLAGDGPPVWPLEIDGGFPQLGHPHDLFGGPFALPLLLVPAIVGVKVLVVALAALGSAGMAALARRGLNMRPGACALAGALFTVGGALPAYIRSGAINKSFLVLLPWLLVGYHAGGRRGAAVAGLSAAAIVLDAGWAALFGFVGAAAWIALDQLGRPRLNPRLVGGALALVLALSAGKLAGARLLLNMPSVALPKKTETVAAYFEKADFFDPLSLPASLITRPILDGPLAPLDFDVFFLGLPAAALLLLGLTAARRRWRLALLTAALFFLASRANATWGPFRLLLEVAEPARGLWKLDKYSLVMVAMVLSLWAAAGYDALLDWLERRERPLGSLLAIGTGLLIALPAFVANRPLIGDLFPGEAPALPLAELGCPEPAVIEVRRSPDATVAEGHWQDNDALLRFLVVRDGGVVSQLSDFERDPPGTRPCGVITANELDWRLLLSGSRPLYTSAARADAPIRPARLLSDDTPISASLGAGSASAVGLDGSGGTLVFNLPYHPAWRLSEGTLRSVDGQLAAEVSPGVEALSARLPTSGITAAWALSQLVFWLVFGWLVLGEMRQSKG